MQSSRLPHYIASRLRLPLIAAPMLRVSGSDLVSAACSAGVIGAFPTKNARTTDELDSWLTQIERRNGDVNGAPYCPNLIMRDARLGEDLACIVRHRTEIVITSVGSPAPAVGALHDIGGAVRQTLTFLRFGGSFAPKLGACPCKQSRSNGIDFRQT